MSHIQIRISDEQKKSVKEVLDTMNLTYSGAIKLFFEELLEAGEWPYKEQEVHFESKKVEESKIADNPQDIPQTEDSTYMAQSDNTSFAWNPFKSRKIG